jgi:hypothetical protein
MSKQMVLKTDGFQSYLELLPFAMSPCYAEPSMHKAHIELSSKEIGAIVALIDAYKKSGQKALAYVSVGQHGVERARYERSVDLDELRQKLESVQESFRNHRAMNA